MKAALIVGLVLLAMWAAGLAGFRQGRLERRITQLEMALAQAHAEADTLEAMLEEDR